MWPLALALWMTGCAPWTPLSQNPNRLRSPERQRYEECLRQASDNEAACQTEKQALLRQQEWEMLSPDR